jgi:hypothetical protein
MLFSPMCSLKFKVKLVECERQEAESVPLGAHLAGTTKAMLSRRRYVASSAPLSQRTFFRQWIVPAGIMMSTSAVFYGAAGLPLPCM